MITAARLKDRTRDDLAQMAKRKGVTGWYSMRKDQLVRALVVQVEGGFVSADGATGLVRHRRRDVIGLEHPGEPVAHVVEQRELLVPTEGLVRELHLLELTTAKVSEQGEDGRLPHPVEAVKAYPHGEWWLEDHGRALATFADRAWRR